MTAKPFSCQTVYSAGRVNAPETDFVTQGISDAKSALIARAPDLLADNERLRQVNAELVAALELAELSIDNYWNGLPVEGWRNIRDTARTALAKYKDGK